MMMCCAVSAVMDASSGQHPVCSDSIDTVPSSSQSSATSCHAPVVDVTALTGSFTAGGANTPATGGANTPGTVPATSVVSQPFQFSVAGYDFRKYTDMVTVSESFSNTLKVHGHDQIHLRNFCRLKLNI